MKKKNLGGLDYFKMAAAFLVVAIHTSPLASFHGDADFVLTRIIARTAVPFFLMVTGYFTLSGYLSGETADLRPLFRSVKKTLLLYMTAVILYLPVNIYAGQLKGLKTADFLRMLIFDGTFYHLWYLPAAVTGILLLVLLYRIALLCRPAQLYQPARLHGSARLHQPARLHRPAQLHRPAHLHRHDMEICTETSQKQCFGTLGAAAAALYIVGLFGDSYYGLTEGADAVRAAYDRMFRLFSYTRNGIFYAPVFLLLGAWLPHSKRKNKTAVNIGGFLLSMAFMTAEGLWLNRIGAQRHDSMYLTLLPCMFFLFQLILAIKAEPAERLRTVSTWIYLIHPWIIIAVRGAAKITHSEKILIDNSLIHYVTVCILSWLLAELIRKILPGSKNPPYKKGRAWIEVSRKNLKYNVDALQSLLPPGCRLMPVLKANAYGHGAPMLAEELNAYGIKSFCVATASEAAELRKNGIKGELLILGYTHPEQFGLLSRYRLTQTVVDASYAKTLNAYGKKINVHIKIDTGMHRLGEHWEKTDEICRIFQCRNLVIKGIYTHLSADDALTPRERAFTEAQGQAFRETVKKLEQRGFHCPSKHLQASYGILNYPELTGDYARIGIALYGMLSSRGDEKNIPIRLRPVLTVKARVAAVKDLHCGEAAGYGFGYVAAEERKIAVLAIGYADGLPRPLSCGIGQVLLKGRKAPIIGYICMDQTIVDITDIPDVKQGDTAYIIGKAGNSQITAYDLAEQTGTITNEILSRLGGRLERILV